jgi:hypothetical protein
MRNLTQNKVLLKTTGEKCHFVNDYVYRKSSLLTTTKATYVTLAKGSPTPKDF